MEAEQRSASTRPGTPGLDVFKIAGRSISGFVHSFKTGDPRRVRQSPPSPATFYHAPRGAFSYVSGVPSACAFLPTW